MALTDAELALVKTEVTVDDTLALGLPALATSGETQAIADLLNEIRGSITVSRNSITGDEFLDSLDVSEIFDTAKVSEQSQAWVRALVVKELLDLTSTTIRNILRDLFPNATAPLSRAGVLAKVQRNGSLLEEILNRVGANASHSDVANALALP